MENRQNIKDMELQAFLDKDDSQMQKRLAEQLGVSQQAVSDRLRDMGNIQKTGTWVSREEWQENEKRAKTLVTFRSLGTKGSRSCIV